MRAPSDHRNDGNQAPSNGQAGPVLASGASIVRSRLFIKYVALFVAVVGLALVVNGAFDIYFSYKEQKTSLIRVQREQAEAAAGKIGQFINEVPLRRTATVAAGASDYRAGRDRFDWSRTIAGVPARHGSGRQRQGRLRRTGVHGGGCA